MLGIQITPRRLRRVRIANARRTRGWPRNRTKYTYERYRALAFITEQFEFDPEFPEWLPDALDALFELLGTKKSNSFSAIPGRETWATVALVEVFSATEATYYRNGEPIFIAVVMEKKVGYKELLVPYFSESLDQSTNSVEIARRKGWLVKSSKKIFGTSEFTRGQAELRIKWRELGLKPGEYQELYWK